jgi:hypothetical protein
MAICAPGHLAGQAASSSGGEGVELLTAVPESPAFAFLGISPTKITRPGAVRDFAVAVLTGINEEGNVQQGVALETTPWGLIPGMSISLDDYQRSWLKYVLANAQLSVGTARAAGDSAPTDLAVGLRLTLWDEGDPMRSRDFTEPLAAELRACLPDTPDVEEETVARCVDEKMRQAYAAYGEHTKNQWNARRAALGLATGVRFVNSELSQGGYGGFQTWFVGSNPVTNYGQLLLQLTFADRPGFGDQPGFKLLTYGGRCLVGSASFNGFVEVVSETLSSDDKALDDARGRWSAGVEFRLASQLWLATGFGSRFATIEAAEKTFVILDLRWGLNSTARLDGLRRP